MRSISVAAPRRLRGVITVPGDKSLSHRAVMLNAVAEGDAQITHFLTGADCMSTVGCMRALGVQVEVTGDTVVVRGAGLHALREPADVLDCGNSGTTLRLLTGLLAGLPLFAVLSGDASLRSRPQRRIVEPLRAMGAQLDGRDRGDRAPLVVRGARVSGGSYQLPIPSAQVKSALLLAALGAEAPLVLSGRTDSRDHTERMLVAMGAALEQAHGVLTLTPGRPLQPLSLRVPGDPSSAAFWWVAAAVHPDAELTTTGVCLNPTRTGALDVLRDMGADLVVHNQRIEGSEPVGDVTVRSSRLQGTTIAGGLIPRLIDEIPVLAVAAACAQGETVVRDAHELRAKETDRIATVTAGLAALGVRVDTLADGLVVQGGRQLQATTLESHGDHRLAMAWAVALSTARGTGQVRDPQVVDVSYPGFWDVLAQIGDNT